MTTQDTRRARLAQLIQEKYGGSQTKFVEETGESQSEVSGLLRSKSFGERKARKIEQKAGLTPGWLDGITLVDEAHRAEQADLGDKLEKVVEQLAATLKIGYVATSKPEWMALVYLTQRELDLITRFRQASDSGKGFIEASAESSSREELGTGAAHQF
jgi:hypothetical protein